MPSKEILNDILTRLRANRNEYAIIENTEWWDSPRYDEYADALLWLMDKGLIDASLNTELGHMDRRANDVFAARINTNGRDFHDNGCQFTPPSVKILLDDAQLKEILILLARNVEGEAAGAKLAGMFKNVGEQVATSLATDAVKNMLAYLAKIAHLAS